MQIGIDLNTKTITLYGKVNIEELLDTIELLDITEGEWSLQVEPITVYQPSWQQPVIHPYAQPYVSPYTAPSIPWQQPVTWCTMTADYSQFSK